MKNIFITILSISLPLISFSQEPFVIDTVLWVEDSAEAKELYSRAKVWLAESFNDANSVIELDDPENFQIFGSGRGLDIVFEKFAHQACNGYYTFDIKLFFKDGRFRIELSNFFHYANSSNFDLGLLYNEGHLDGYMYNSDGKLYAKQREPINSQSFDNIRRKSLALFLSAQSHIGQPHVSKSDDW